MNIVKGTVKIPSDHFAKSVRIQYRNPSEALIREILQNSIDAGATQINFELGEDWMQVVDNGQGMDQNTIIDGMLTFGGSKKKEGDIGGFGLAKEIILFQHAQFKIETHNLQVEGSGLEYNLLQAEYTAGTKIWVKFHALFDYKQEALEKTIRGVVGRSKVTSSVTLNGVQIPQSANNPARCARHLKWCKVLVENKTGAYEYNVDIRYKGLFMFSVYIGKYEGKNCTVELIGKSIDILTGTRDGLISGKYEQLQEILNKLVINPLSFGSETHNPKTIIYKGQNAYTITKALNEYAITKNPEILSALLHSNTPGITEKIKNIASITNNDQEEVIRKVLEEIESHIENDFVIHLDNHKLRKVPPKYAPEQLKGKNLYIAKAWKYAISQAMLALRNNDAYKTGWILHQEKQACYTILDCAHCFLLNPMHADITKRSTNELLPYLLSLALHEVAHVKELEHNEIYASVLTQITTNLLSSLKSRTLVKANIQSQKL